MSEISWITEDFAIGPRQDVGQLKSSGIQSIIDMDADPHEADEAKRAGIEYHSCMLKDESSNEDWLMGLDRISRILRESKKSNRRVFLHCTHGIGRSPTAAVAYLIDNGYSMDDAIDLVTRKHPSTWSPGNPVVKYRQVLDNYRRIKARRVETKASKA